MPRPRAASSLGFTLLELMVVLLVLGILAAIAIPGYIKTLESTKAGVASTLVYQLGSSNRLYAMDNPRIGVVSGKLTNACGSVCGPPYDACSLVACNTLAKQDWDSKPYDFYVCRNGTGGPCCAAGATACATRKSDAPPTSAGWGYRVGFDDWVVPLGGAPDAIR